MTKRVQELIAIALLGALLPGMASPAGGGPPGTPPGAVLPGAVLPDGGDWIVEESDNVCGLKDSRQLSTPAVVDYDKLIEATAELREMKRKRIDKDSPEGQLLYNKAVDRVRTAASELMKTKGYDSVWKSIRHRRGQKAADATDEIKALIEKSTAA